MKNTCKKWPCQCCISSGLLVS